ncbi:MAG: type III PLP-dependent enzyme [Alphaproteobacteria bacterium]|nr:type III PLP-dependent enzyme [Alphaproteobacteria bacterium]MBV9377287.1 type III PLP-dependent enzyme [Alphaproteobacteria bacterium]
MAKVRLAAAGALGRAILPNVDAVVADARPTDPLLCLRPATIAAAARQFAGCFPGDVLYAVKCNPDARVLRALWAGGIRHFDCASLTEVELVRALLPAAEIHLMHPVKSRPAIRNAFERYGVTDFAFDSAEEMAKILQETVPVGLVGDPPLLGLFVRLALPKGNAVYDLSGKFGAPLGEAIELLRTARPHAARLGIAFHVGSQCLDPDAYTRAMALAGEAIAGCGVAVDIIDVGGGFPVSYPGMAPPPLADYIAAISAGVSSLPSGVRLWAEPGRALVAAGGSIVVQVLLRRGDTLFVNDGTYGNLSDAGVPAFRFPARRIRPGRPEDPEEELADFGLFGPTCDSADRMSGPFRLPADMQEGDWIELGQLGAYGACLRTGFNGFDRTELVEVTDPPMLVTPGYQ